jgi:hypothetical protein
VRGTVVLAKLRLIAGFAKIATISMIPGEIDLRVVRAVCEEFLEAISGGWRFIRGRLWRVGCGR